MIAERETDRGPDAEADPVLDALLRLAVSCGDAAAVGRHLSAGADPDCRDALGNTPLLMAAASGDARICQLLLENGADPTLANHQGRTVLTTAGAGTARGAEPPPPQSVWHSVPDDGESWEADETAAIPADAEGVAALAAAQQAILSGEHAGAPDEDWSDVAVWLPPADILRSAPAAGGTGLPVGMTRTADDILAATLLSQVVLNTKASPVLRRALTRSRQFGMSVAAFLQENDGEALFRRTAGLPTSAYLELSDLVNDYVSQVHHSASPV